MTTKDFFDKNKQGDRTFLIIYVIYVLLNGLLLVIGLTTGDQLSHREFFPLGGLDEEMFETYDLSEFLIYSLAPIGFYIVIKLIHYRKRDDGSNKGNI